MFPLLGVVFGCAVVALPAQAGADAKSTLSASPRLEKILAGGEPTSLAEVREMERHLKALLAKVLPATVLIGGATGVVVEGGYVLTAGHVSRKSGQSIPVYAADGRRIRTQSLGLSNNTDTGLLKIDGEQDVPYLKMGRSSELRPGQWCVMLGFPGGKREGLTPPLRLGRVLRLAEPGRGYLVTDCTMSAGDSGGPLFDMEGRVIGINSRITGNLQQNMHTPIDAFHLEWKQLLAGEVMGRPRERNRRGAQGAPAIPGWLGMEADPMTEDARIRTVIPDSPASRAGVRPGDVVLRLNNRKIFSIRTLARQEGRLRKGDHVAIQVRRGGEELVLRAVAEDVKSRPEQPKDKSKNEKRVIR